MPLLGKTRLQHLAKQSNEPLLGTIDPNKLRFPIFLFFELDVLKPKSPGVK
jgi:hypothetical protein